MKRCRGLLGLLGALGCGVQTVELAPHRADVLLLDDLPASTPSRFESAAPGAREDPMLNFLYPAGAAALPGNFPPITFSWERGKKAPMEPDEGEPTIFELRLTSDSGRVLLYTQQLSAVLPGARWRDLLRVSSGRSLTAQLRSLDAAGMLRTGKPLVMEARAPLTGKDIYYWSASAPHLQRLSSDDWQAAPVPEASQSGCAACWAISPDGSQLLEASSSGAVQLRSLVDGSVQQLLAAPPLAQIDSCSLDIAGTRALCSGPQASAWYGASASALAPSPLGAIGFAPDGRRAVFSAAEQAMVMPMDAASRLQQAELLPSGELTNLTTLFETDKADEVLAFPAYASDGQLIGFQRSKGPMGKDTSLWLVPAIGGEAVALSPGKQDETPALLRAEADEYWLVFSSAREHGAEKLAPDQTQLWLWAARYMEGAPIELAEAPLWLPFQASGDSNQRPQWSSRQP